MRRVQPGTHKSLGKRARSNLCLRVFSLFKYKFVFVYDVLVWLTHCCTFSVQYTLNTPTLSDWLGWQCESQDSCRGGNFLFLGVEQGLASLNRSAPPPESLRTKARCVQIRPRGRSGRRLRAPGRGPRLPGAAQEGRLRLIGAALEAAYHSIICPSLYTGCWECFHISWELALICKYLL